MREPIRSPPLASPNVAQVMAKLFFTCQPPPGANLLASNYAVGAALAFLFMRSFFLL